MSWGTDMRVIFDANGNSLMNRFSHFGVDLKDDAGAVGNGTTDDTNAFNTAHQEALAANTFVLVPEGTYYIKASTLSAISVASMVGKGIGKSILKVSGNINFNLPASGAYILNGIEIQWDYLIPSTTYTGNALFVNYTATLDGVRVRDIKFVNSTSTQDGTSRTPSFFRCHASHAVFQDIQIDGSHTGMVISKVAGTPLTDVAFRNIKMTNCQTGIYCTGQNPNNAVTNIIKDISFENISLVNTAAQALQYNQINGSDCIMLECCNSVSMENIYAEFACERTMYLNVCQDVKIGDVYALNTEGVKYVGFRSIATSVNNYAEGCHIDSITLHTTTNQKACRAFVTYWSKNVTINKINAFDDSAGVNTSGVDKVVEINQDVIGLSLNNISAVNALRGVVFLNIVYNSDYPTHVVSGLSIKGVVGQNVVTGPAGYAAINYYVDPALTTAMQQYVFQHVIVEGCTVEQMLNSDGSTFNGMYSSSSILTCLYNLDRVSYFRARNNYAKGISNLEGFAVIGQNSYDVIVRESGWCSSGKFKGYYFSQGSVLDFIQSGDSSKTGMVRNRVQITSVANDSMATGLSEANQQGQFEWYGSLANGQSVTLPWDSNCNLGDGYVYDGAANYMHFLIQGTTLTKIDGTTATAVSNTASDLCVYLSGSTLTLLNNLGSTRRVGLKFTYSV